MPITPFIGVRISWLMLARNSDFEREASTASASARRRSYVGAHGAGGVDGAVLVGERELDELEREAVGGGVAFVLGGLTGAQDLEVGDADGGGDVGREELVVGAADDVGADLVHGLAPTPR